MCHMGKSLLMCDLNGAVRMGFINRRRGFGFYDRAAGRPDRGVDNARAIDCFPCESPRENQYSDALIDYGRESQVCSNVLRIER